MGFEASNFFLWSCVRLGDRNIPQLSGRRRGCGFCAKAALSHVPLLKHMHRQVDVNRPELFCPCPEMARHEAAVGVGVLRVMVQPRAKPC